jgi:anaerobic magnesium-protoporphyrin IX monomethyl ester cyclase
MSKKVILLSIGNDYLRYNRVFLMSPPLGILALGSYLTGHDVPVELIDVQMDFGFGLTRDAERIVFQRTARYLCDRADDIAWAGISQLSSSGSGVALAQEIHAALPEVPIVLGGYFPSCNYRLLLQYPFITAVVRGDGEAAALQISRSLACGQPFLSDQTPNLAWLDEGEIRTTPIQPIALEDLPILDFRLLRNKSHYQVIGMMTSRGCPFRCNYCLESSMRSYASYPLEWVARQLEHIEAELPNTYVFIFDPLFGLGNERTLELCRMMSAHRFTYGMESRADVLAPDLVPALREAGVELVLLGVESASPATLLRMSKVRSLTEAEDYIEDAFGILKACFENNMVPLVSLMLGFPGDSEADLRATLEFVKEVYRLHSRIVAQTGVRTGFIPAPQLTEIYDGSLLAACIGRDFPEVVLRPELEGERSVVSPSPGLDREVVLRYLAEIGDLGGYTRQALAHMEHFFGFSARDLVASAPELTDDEGVTVLWAAPGASMRESDDG